MPTLHDWQLALLMPRIITITYSQSLADDVNKLPKTKSFRGKPKTAIGISKFTPRSEIVITPARLLHSIGRITTPRIANLVDLCSTWASIRYLWAFKRATKQTRLCLSDDAKDLDNHQKAVLSDDIGVGMAAYFVERFFGGRHPIDATVLLSE